LQDGVIRHWESREWMAGLLTVMINAGDSASQFHVSLILPQNDGRIYVDFTVAVAICRPLGSYMQD